MATFLKDNDESLERSTFVELAFNSFDPKTGEGDLLTCFSNDAFISVNGKFRIEEFCVITGIRSDEQTQKFFCLKTQNTGIGVFQNKNVGIVIKSIDGTKFEFSAYGNIELDDIPYTLFTPINFSNPDIDVEFEGFSMSVASPQVAIDTKWALLSTIPIESIRTLGSEGDIEFLPNPNFEDFVAQNLFIEHLKSIKEALQINH